MNPLSEFFINMNEPKQFGVIGPGFLDQVPTLHPKALNSETSINPKARALHPKALHSGSGFGALKHGPYSQDGGFRK